MCFIVHTAAASKWTLCVRELRFFQTKLALFRDMPIARCTAKTFNVSAGGRCLATHSFPPTAVADQLPVRAAFRSATTWAWPHTSLCLSTRSQELMTVISKGFAPVQLLLVEDSPGDVRLTLEAFRDASTSVKLHLATDGAKAMAFLRHEGITRRCTSPRSHLAGSKPAQNGWPRCSGIDQGG
jgi:hypothetical protein